MAGHVARMELGRSVFKYFTGKLIGKKLLGRHRRRWDHIRRYLKEIDINKKNWVDSAQYYWRILANAT